MNRFITIYHALYGWKPVEMHLNTEDYPDDPFWEPWETGNTQYETQEEAAVEGRAWAESVELPFIEYGGKFPEEEES